MPRKRPRTDQDVERLAAELRERWSPAHGISPWLRRMGPRLHRMVRDDSWAWADIGRAMTLAGITYESGKPWTGTLLMVKAAQARKQIRDRANRASPSSAATFQGSPMVTVLPAQDRARPDALDLFDQGAEANEPTFALASLAASEFDDAKQRPARTEAAPPKTALSRPRADAEEILRLLQGGPIQPDKKD